MVDEISMGLAPIVVGHLFDALRGIAASGASLLLVEQYVEAALELADYVYVMDKGAVVDVGERSVRPHVGRQPAGRGLAGRPDYPGNIAADLGSLLQTFGAPALPLNDPLLAESKFRTSPGYPAHATFDHDQADLHHEEQQRLLELIVASLAPQRIGTGAGRRGRHRRVGALRDGFGDGVPPCGLRRDRAPPRRPAGPRCGRADRDAALPDLPARLTTTYGSATSMTMSSSSPGAGGVYRWAARTSRTHPTTA